MDIPRETRARRYSSPNAGVVLGDNYYYSKNLGRDGGETIHFVSGIGADDPTHHDDDALVAFSDRLYDGAVLDFAAVDEDDGANIEYVVDDEDDGAYLVGLGASFEVVVIRLNDDGYPERYAVLDASVDWADQDASSDDSGFGAAYARPRRNPPVSDGLLPRRLSRPSSEGTILHGLTGTPSRSSRASTKARTCISRRTAGSARSRLCCRSPSPTPAGTTAPIIRTT